MDQEFKVHFQASGEEHLARTMRSLSDRYANLVSTMAKVAGGDEKAMSTLKGMMTNYKKLSESSKEYMATQGTLNQKITALGMALKQAKKLIEDEAKATDRANKTKLSGWEANRKAVQQYLNKLNTLNRTVAMAKGQVLTTEAQATVNKKTGAVSINENTPRNAAVVAAEKLLVARKQELSAAEKITKEDSEAEKYIKMKVAAHRQMVSQMNKQADATAKLSGVQRNETYVSQYNPLTGGFNVGTVQKAANAMTSVRTGAAGAAENANKFHKGLSKSFDMLRSIKHIMAVSLGYHIFYGTLSYLRQSVDEAAKLSKAIAEIQTISQDNPSSNKDWQKDIIGTSNKFGIGTSDVTEATYQALSNQIAGTREEIMKFVAAATQLGTTTQSTATDGVNLLSSAIRSYNLKAKDATKLSSVFFKSVELGRFRVKDISDSVGNVFAYSSQLGVSIEQVMATFNMLTQKGIQPSVAMTQMKNMFAKMISPTEDFRNYLLETLHYTNSESAIAGMGFENFVSKITEFLKGDAEDLAKFFPNMRGYISGLTQFMNKDASEYTRQLNALKEASLNYGEAQDIMAESSGRAWDKLKTAMTNTFTQGFGDVLINELKLQGGTQEEFQARLQQITDAMGRSTEQVAKGVVIAAKGGALALDTVTGAGTVAGEAWAKVVDYVDAYLKKADEIARHIRTIGTGQADSLSEQKEKYAGMSDDEIAAENKKQLEDIKKKEEIAKKWAKYKQYYFDNYPTTNYYDYYGPNGLATTGNYTEAFGPEQSEIIKLFPTLREVENLYYSIDNRIQLLREDYKKLSTEQGKQTEEWIRLEDVMVERGPLLSDSMKPLKNQLEAISKTYKANMKPVLEDYLDKMEKVKEALNNEVQSAKNVATEAQSLSDRLALSSQKTANKSWGVGAKDSTSNQNFYAKINNVDIEKANTLQEQMDSLKQQIDNIRDMQGPVSKSFTYWKKATINNLKDQLGDVKKQYKKALQEEDLFDPKLITQQLSYFDESIERTLNEGRFVNLSSFKKMVQQLKEAEANNDFTLTETLRGKLLGTQEDIESSVTSYEAVIDRIGEVIDSLTQARDEALSVVSDKDSSRGERGYAKRQALSIQKYIEQYQKQRQEYFSYIQDLQASSSDVYGGLSEQESARANTTQAIYVKLDDAVKQLKDSMEKANWESDKFSYNMYQSYLDFAELNKLIPNASANFGSLSQDLYNLATESQRMKDNMDALTRLVTNGDNTAFELIRDAFTEATSFGTNLQVHENIRNVMDTIIGSQALENSEKLYRNLGRIVGYMAQLAQTNISNATQYDIPMPEYTDAPTYKKGGYVFTPKGTDTIPAMLSPGEFIMNSQSTRMYLPLLRAMNSGQSGLLTRLLPRLNNQPRYYSKGGPVTANLTVNYSGKSNTISREDVLTIGKMLKKEIGRGMLTPLTK